MRFRAGLFLAGLLCLPAQAQQSLPLTGAGGKFHAAVAATFTGLGDCSGCLSPVKAYWGLRAFSSATRGNNIANVCDSTGGVDVACSDMVSDATTGDLVSKAIGGVTCPGANCTVKTIYDQSGAAFCSGSTACNLTQATIASRPTLVANCIGGTKACMRFSGSQSLNGTAAAFPGTAQPFTASFVSSRTGATSSFGTVFDSGGNGIFLGYNNSAGNGLLDCGSVVTAAMTDNAFHAVQAVCNGASSDMNIDGSQNTLSAGTNATADTVTMGGTLNLTGDVGEMAFYAAASNTTQSSAQSSNQHSYWGF